MSKYVRKLELLLKLIITANKRFNAFCDSKIRLCYFCVLFRYKLRGIKPPCFAIHTKNATYVFSNRSKLKLAATIMRSSYYGFTALRREGEDRPFRKIGMECN